MSDEKPNDYLFSYRYEGASYSFTVPANSEEEACGRVKAMTWASYDGQVFATIPASIGTVPLYGLLIAMYCRIRNALRGYP